MADHFEVRAAGAFWEVRVSESTSRVLSSHATQQRAIRSAKARAATLRGVVTWHDHAGNPQGSTKYVPLEA